MVRTEVLQSAAPLTVLSLFSGIGGFDLGFQAAGLATIQFCEIDPYCRDILARHFPGVPIHGDIRTLEIPAGVDVVCGGPPCQPASLAGARRGELDNRWLWPEFLECCRRARPGWIVAENPIGIASIEPGLAWIMRKMEEMGYEALPVIIGADDVGAPHRRSRVFIVANANGGGCSAACPRISEWKTSSWGSYRLVRTGRDGLFPAPGVYRMADGLPNWVDRTSTLGNAIIPRIAEIIGRGIIEVNNLTS
jgi:DNA (cytosine-5)-methyltransferase 1